MNWMLPALYDSARATLFRWSLLAVGSGVAFMPLVGSTSVMKADGSTPIGGVLAGTQAMPALRAGRVSAARDPFVPQAVELPENATVRAVILGTTPHALLELGSRTVVVGIGDIVGGLRVSEIDDRGVLLSDGSLLPMQGVQP